VNYIYTTVNVRFAVTGTDSSQFWNAR